MKQYRGVTLRPVLRSDLPMLFALLGDPDRFHLWGQRRICDEAQFYETWRVWSSQRMDGKFVVLKHSRPIGLVFDYERSAEDGHTKVATVLFEGLVGKGDGIIASALFVLWLFEQAALRKVYMDVFGFNAPVVSMLRKLHVKEEMKRSKHRYWQGQYWDQFGFALTREELPALQQRLFRGAELERSPQIRAVNRAPQARRQEPRPAQMTSSDAVGNRFDAALNTFMTTQPETVLA